MRAAVMQSMCDALFARQTVSHHASNACMYYHVNFCPIVLVLQNQLVSILIRDNKLESFCFLAKCCCLGLDMLLRTIREVQSIIIMEILRIWLWC